ncbi:HNH endonuclease [Vibrio splendidus]|uniref:HNH endonuclease n=1 Tax=Vibrio splendidus TaxID=29497 RepID=UPI001E2FE80C|nr:HNH endonuclease signature motif containing protein [Vibrio splendidus]MCC4790053.1 HNH endonuclease [Vibrio splendidus]
MGCKTIGTSWYPLRESMFAKRADKTLVSEKKSGLPSELHEFFGIDTTVKRQVVELEVNGKLISANVTQKDPSRYQIDLSSIIAELSPLKFEIDKEALIFEKHASKIEVRLSNLDLIYQNYFLKSLEEWHSKRLQWAMQKQGEIVPWKDINQSDFMICSTAKGIYKPKDMPFALSVKQTLSSPYADELPVYDEDGNWSYKYYQEGEPNSKADNYATNQGLNYCKLNNIPVVVCIQEAKKPQPVTYKIVGIGRVASWKDGIFTIQSINTLTYKRHQDLAIDKISDSQSANNQYDPRDEQDGRERAYRQIVARRGQAAFRRSLLRAYNSRCAITGTSIEGVLEAAHITPYNGADSNHVTNGILLRADIHTLWDLDLLAIDEETYTVLIADELKGSVYSDLKGKAVSLPEDVNDRPSKACLSIHRNTFGL